MKLNNHTSLSNSIILYGVGAFLMRGIGFFLIPVLTRTLTVEEYGLLALINLIVSLITPICLCGVSTAAMRFFIDVENEEEVSELYGTSITLLLVVPVIVVSVLYPVFLLLSEYLLGGYSLQILYLALLICVFAPMIQLIAGYFRVRKQPVRYIIYHVLFFLIQAALSVWLLVVLNMGLMGQVIAITLANFFFFLIALVIFRLDFNLRFDRQTAFRLLEYGIPLLPFFVFLWLCANSGRFVLESVSTLTQVGLLSLALQFSGLIRIVANAFEQALFPAFMDRAKSSNASQSISKLLLVYSAFFGLIAIWGANLTQLVIPFVSAEEYHDSVSLIPLSCLVVWITVLNFPIIWSFNFLKKSTLLSLTHLVGFTVIASGLYYFVYLEGMGAIGVLLATLASQLATLFIGFFVAQRGLNLILSYKDLSLTITMVMLSFLLLEYIAVDSVFRHIGLTLLSLILVSTAGLLAVTRGAFQSIKV